MRTYALYIERYHAVLHASRDIGIWHRTCKVINTPRACAARVTVVVLCVCICVCVQSYLPHHTLESQKRDTNGFCAIQGSF